jgi:shikimate dehydrogenase
MDQLRVIGNPIAQSKSPFIHQQFAAQFKIPLNYERQLLTFDTVEAFITDFFASGGKGLNVTMPFKQVAFNQADKVTNQAKKAGAVNTLWVEDNQICGDTTDGYGLITDLLRHGVELQHKKILVIGAGGAVRGILQDLLSQQPCCIHIVNRTLEKAVELVTIFNDSRLAAYALSSTLSEKYDVIINGTSTSLAGEIPKISTNIFHSDSVAYDMVYQANITSFNLWASQQGCTQTIDGLGMLVAQAAKSFELWYQLQPDIEPVIELLRQQLNKNV